MGWWGVWPANALRVSRHLTRPPPPSFFPSSLLLYFGKHQEEVNLYCPPDTVQNIAQQMQIHTNGSLILELELKRTDASQPWGFTVLGPKVQTVAPGGIARSV